MKITAKQLFDNADGVYLNGEVVVIEEAFPNKYNKYNVLGKPCIVFTTTHLREDEKYYIYSSDTITLDEKGEGIVNLFDDPIYNSMSEDPSELRKFTIRACVESPLNSIEMAKRAIGLKT